MCQRNWPHINWHHSLFFFLRLDHTNVHIWCRVILHWHCHFVVAILSAIYVGFAFTFYSLMICLFIQFNSKSDLKSHYLTACITNFQPHAKQQTMWSNQWKEKFHKYLKNIHCHRWSDRLCARWEKVLSSCKFNFNCDAWRTNSNNKYWIVLKNCVNDNGNYWDMCPY